MKVTVTRVMDGEKLLGVEVVIEDKELFYAVDQEAWPSIRVGRFIPSLDAPDFTRTVLADIDVEEKVSE